ncbi:hypothetical protein [Rubritalea tangerina]|uniref:hypothetical protein n=1 Tax=Rubritalea tangerina TaxID=430798 RepID=UPI0036105232
MVGLKQALKPLAVLVWLSGALAWADDEVTGWVKVFDGDANSTLTAGSTASPAVSRAQKTSIVSKISSVTLEDGYELTLSGEMTVGGALGEGQFRVGLFDAPDPLVATGGDGYVGVYASEQSMLKQDGVGDLVHPFTGGVTLGAGSASGSYQANSPVYFELILRRKGNELTGISSFRQANGYLATNQQSYAASHFIVDTVGFLHGGGFADTELAYKNVRVAYGESASVVDLIEDRDEDGMPDDYEEWYGLDPDVDDGGLSLDGDGLSNLEEYLGVDGIAETGDETSPAVSDSDGDGSDDGQERQLGTDPNTPANAERLFGIDFNRSDSLGTPSQSRFRVISGSQNSAENTSEYWKKIGMYQVKVSQVEGEALRFLGGNGDSSRAIPGGQLSCSYLVTDFVGTTAESGLQIEFFGLPAGVYYFRSYHIDSYTGSGFGYAQAMSPELRNTVLARHGAKVLANTQPTCMGVLGLNTTSLNDRQIPMLRFALQHDGDGPLSLQLSVCMG